MGWNTNEEPPLMAGWPECRKIVPPSGSRRLIAGPVACGEVVPKDLTATRRDVGVKEG